VDSGGNVVTLASDEEGRLSQLSRPTVDLVPFLYDGRSFLTQAGDPATTGVVEPTYSSEGLLHGLRREVPPGAPEKRLSYLYFAGRPVAQLREEGGVSTWTFLTTDHLGTPLVATDLVGADVWGSQFEPFGRDFAEGTAEGALAKGLALRFPGQWEIGVWGEAGLGLGGLVQNVHRWYESGVGRYTRVDPIGVLWPDSDNLVRHLYGYAESHCCPTNFHAISSESCEGGS
jgi:uncharacterized protein RhaS with RHS repeats